jgi:hypothetical protein
MIAAAAEISKCALAVLGGVPDRVTSSGDAL